MALINKLKAIANAIRSKTNKTEELTLEQMADEVSGIDVMQGLNFSSIYDQEQANELNQYYKDGIAYAENIKNTWTNPSYLANKYANNINIINFPKVNMSNAKECALMFSRALFLESAYVDCVPTDCRYMFQRTFKCKKIWGKIDFANIGSGVTGEGLTNTRGMFTESGIKETPTLLNTNVITDFYTFFSGCFGVTEIIINTDSANNMYNMIGNCVNLKKATFTSVKNCTNFANILNETRALEEWYFTEWKQGDINIPHQNNFKSKCFKYIVWHALNGDNGLGFENQGATSRTLKLQSSLYTQWESFKDTLPSVEDCELLDVDESEITKYVELTWEDIALNVKLITIAK